MNYTQIFSPLEIENAQSANMASLFYFSTPTCSVCKVLKPKILDLLGKEFPLFRAFYIDIEQSPLLAGQLRIFTIPVVLVYFEGKEFIRISRNISIDELKKSIERPYSLLF